MNAHYLVLAMMVQCGLACALYLYQQQYAQAIMFFGYTIANAGIMLIGRL